MDKGGGFSLSKKLPIIYSALLLTGVNLLLRLVGTGFQVYLSGKIGASGIGLLQLVMSVGSFSMIAGIAGIRTATMYLTAEELGTSGKRNIPWLLSGCFSYSILCSSIVAVLLILLSPFIASGWINNPKTVQALRIFAAFLPVSCLCSVMTGYFTAANRIGTLAAVEVAEQFASMIITLAMLRFWDGADPVTACRCVITGSCGGSCLTLLCLTFLYQQQKILPGPRIPVKRRIQNTAIPLALADLLRSSISTVENLMVPKRLSRNTRITDPLAAFGMVSGMVFPVLMFPACILYGLSELMIPEISRCNASGLTSRVRYLTLRCLKFAMLYGFFFSGLMYLSADAICLWLYDNLDASSMLRGYALLIPMLYCDTITDALTKGLGRQKDCVQYNILTSVLDVMMLFFLLPSHGMHGYYLSFLISHLINFYLSLRLLLTLAGKKLPISVPILIIICSAFSLAGANTFRSLPVRIIVYPAMLFSLLNLSGILNRSDMIWIRRLFTIPHMRKKPAA